MDIIRKSELARTSSNLGDYESYCRDFTWQSARNLISGLPGGALNIGHEAIERHIVNGMSSKLAIRWLAKDGSRRDLTYLDMSRQTNRFANVLSQLGVKKGDRVFTLLGRVPELYVAALGALKLGAVFSPLFAAFGPEPVMARLTIGDARILVTTREHYLRKVAPGRHALVQPLEILLIDEDEASIEGTCCLPALMRDASDEFAIVQTMPEDMALLHFTSGTTGRPKGAIHVHEAVVAHALTGRLALDLRPCDTYWCTADPGWVTGTSYGIISPLVNRVTMVVDEADYDPHRWYEILERERVNVWYTAPTAIRMLMRAGALFARRHNFSQLRFLASVGEPLNPEAVRWGQEVFGIPFHDNWWQTETGGIMIANFASMDVKPGSMGKPLPGIEAAIVERTDEGICKVDDAMTVGELALRSGWPSMMRGYLHEEERYRKCFAQGWYLSGDLAMRDDDGYFWFVGRRDDVIKSAGHLIGPFEVESALMEHPAVAEAAVIGIPDRTVGEVVKAYVVLKSEFQAGEDLRLDLLGYGRKRLGPAIAPKEIAFCIGLPRTRSGKIMRRLLKARELGLEEGDLSALESDERRAP